MQRRVEATEWRTKTTDVAKADGVASVSFRLELGWKVSDFLTAFAFVEQYEVVGGDARRTNRASSYRCAHNDWTLGGVGLRMSF